MYCLPYHCGFVAGSRWHDGARPLLCAKRAQWRPARLHGVDGDVVEPDAQLACDGDDDARAGTPVAEFHVGQGSGGKPAARREVQLAEAEPFAEFADPGAVDLEPLLFHNAATLVAGSCHTQGVLPRCFHEFSRVPVDNPVPAGDAGVASPRLASRSSRTTTDWLTWWSNAYWRSHAWRLGVTQTASCFVGRSSSMPGHYHENACVLVCSCMGGDGGGRDGMARGSAPGLARVAFRRHRVRPVAEHFAADPADRRHLHPAGRADTAGCQRVGGNTFVLGHAARRGRAENVNGPGRR